MSTLTRLRRARRLALLGALALAALYCTGCSDVDKSERPTPLAKKFVNRVVVRRVWHTHLNGDAPKLRLGLGLAVSGGRVFAASHRGLVEAFDLASGRRLWRRNLKLPLSAGPGVGEGLLVVGSSKGDVVALSQADGTLRWHRRVNAEILSAPAVGGGLVVVRGVDGRLAGLAASDGGENWVVDQQVPRLSLRGASSPIVSGDLAICGFDNGHVLAVVRSTGAIAWNTAVDDPHGNSELQRLIDVDAPVVADGDDLYAVAYQGHLARLARDTGQIVWKHDWSSYRGFALDGGAIYISGADGILARIDRSTGTVQWQDKQLLRRELSAPSVYGRRVVVGDFEGFVHWFDAATGNYLARIQAGKRRISVAPLVAGNLILVLTDAGELSAYRAPPASTAALAPASGAVAAVQGARP